MIARVFDAAAGGAGDYFEIQPLYAQNMVTCFARLDGRSVGIIANQPKVMAGVLDINCLGQGGAVHPLLRRLQHSPGHP